MLYRFTFSMCSLAQEAKESVLSFISVNILNLKIMSMNMNYSFMSHKRFYEVIEERLSL